MDAKKVGGIILFVSIALLVIFIILFQNINDKGKQLGCFNQPGCEPVQASLSYIHVGFGFFGFILALGFYLIFFSSGEEAILNKLNKEESKIKNEEKFQILMLGLDEFEKEILKLLREQPKITQNTLKLRVNMSKAKLSQVLGALEKKGLIKRFPQKKTLEIHLSAPFTNDEQ